MTDVTRKLDEPVYVDNGYARPIPAPVLYDSTHVVATPEDIFRMGVVGPLVTPNDTPLPDGSYRFLGSWWGDYFNRVYVVPSRMSLIDPVIGANNPYVFWNATFGTVTVEAVNSSDDIGVTTDVTAGFTLAAMSLTSANIIVSAAAPASQITSFVFDLDGGLEAFLTVTISKTNIFSQAPEQPLRQTYSWKSDIVTSRDGTERRSSIRQVHRVTYSLKIMFDTDATRNAVYRQFFSKGTQAFSLPIWEQPMRLMADASAGDSALTVDASRYDVRPQDQLFMLRADESFETVTVNTVIGNAVTLYASLLEDFPATQRFYRASPVFLPENASLKHGAINSTETDLSLAVVNARTLFSGTASGVEIGISTVLSDRITSAMVSLLKGCPVIHARPIVKGTLEDTFNWNFEVVDFGTGAFEQTTARTSASVTYSRYYHVKAYYQEFYLNYVMNWMHGQRKPIWLPTWMSEIGSQVVSCFSDTIILNNENFAEEFPSSGSHRGLWIAYNGGWLARQVTSAVADGLGNTVVQISPDLPVDFPLSGPYDIGFLVLARLGSDEVSVERYARYSMFSMSFTSTFSTSTAA